MSNPVSAIAVAQVFLDLASGCGKRLSNTQLQKLVYFAHGIHLAVFDTPLIDDPVKAWDFGPVIPNLYEKLRIFGRGFVNSDLAPETRDHIDPQGNEAKAISSVWNTYKDYDAWQLSAITHIANSPWDKIWKQNNNHYGLIPNHLIADYYKQRIQKRTY